MSLLTTAHATALRAGLLSLLSHTYTRTGVTQGTADDWGDTAATAGSPATALPCLYAPLAQQAAVPVLRADELGRVTVDVPSLRIPATDTLAVGDQVSNIRDQEGTLLLAGPLTVESVRPVAGLGAQLQRRAVLRGARVAE